jgi:hypothetical protein
MVVVVVVAAAVVQVISFPSRHADAARQQARAVAPLG